MMLNSPTDPLEVLCDNAVAAIRRHVDRLHARIANWDLPDRDIAPPAGYRRPTRTGWAR